ncbi:MAG TPA: hypothetical protein VGP47_11460 [Parachlamydiaceae bacterium]|nr:hypothetical protein [Parachlamydiaceae bacterium]
MIFLFSVLRETFDWNFSQGRFFATLLLDNKHDLFLLEKSHPFYKLDPFLLSYVRASKRCGGLLKLSRISGRALLSLTDIRRVTWEVLAL